MRPPALVRTPVAELSGDVVIDTNVWLDWLVFADPSSEPIRRAVERQACRVIACRRTRDELAAVLRRPSFASPAADTASRLASFDRWAVIHDDPPPCALRSRDPDDQVFIDLAACHRARYLLTRDKALLALARRAERDLGLMIRIPNALAA